MKTQFSYKSPFGDYLLTVTGKSAARSLDSLRNARKALAAAQNRISALQADVKERHTCTVRLRKRKDAEISRLRAEIQRLKEDPWFSMLWEENESLRAENAALKEKLASARRGEMDMGRMAARVSKYAYALGHKIDKLSRRLHDVRADRRKWCDTAERCFAAAMKNAVALANERKGERGE